MRVLLLHPEDDLPLTKSCPAWDLVVDFARAPASTYVRWSRRTDCAAISIYDFAEGIDDLRLCRELLNPGLGRLLDRHGIDWWDVLSLGIVPELLQLLLVRRLAQYIGSPTHLYATRKFTLASALQRQLNSTLQIVGGSFDVARQHVKHYRRVLASLDGAQIWQIMQDKFDRMHTIRHVLSRKGAGSKHPTILLPSAYINVSRLAIGYAGLLPEQNFLLVSARRCARVQSLPHNVSLASLDHFFGPRRGEDSYLVRNWTLLKKRLVDDEAIFAVAEHAGILERFDSTMRWLLAVRNAWLNVFDAENIMGCLCADDTNPYTRIPLLLAKSRGLPTVACHHGALDSWMALKPLAAHSYLAKSGMECDYLVHTCGVSPKSIVLASPSAAKPAKATSLREKPWMVFFAEGYGSSGWRSRELYQDLLPRLYLLAQVLGLNLVLKLHPFDSVRDHRRMLRRILNGQARQVQLIAGPPTSDLWNKSRFAVTGESSITLECTARGIPVFLCAWLWDRYSGYGQQYRKSSMGYSLENPEQIAEIPHLMKTHRWSTEVREPHVAPEVLENLFRPGVICESAMETETVNRACQSAS